MTYRIATTTLDDARDRSAREAAHARVSWPVNLAPASVSYHSDGHLLIVGDMASIRRAARHLQSSATLASISLLATAPSHDSEDANDAHVATAALPCHRADRLHIEGHLGAFRIEARFDDTREGIDVARACLGRDTFDLVLDLGSPAQLDLQLPPPGYHATTWGTLACDEALKAIAESVGEFEKPKYFQIQHDICAHASSGKTGCTRCLDVCPAEAIESVNRRVNAHIEIDPFRCHGAGSCTTACPTGAIQYALPRPQEQLDYVTRLLDAYRQAGGSAPVVRFVDQTWRATETASAGHVLDVPLEEQGAAGQEHWLGALADGAAEVRIQRHPGLPPRLVTLVEEQLEQTQRLLAALGHEPQRLRLVETPEQRDAPPRFAPLSPRDVASREPGKRDRLNALIDCLAVSGNPSGRREALPDDSPFGGIDVDAQACTLCMACVAVCPTPALAGGDDNAPQLSFREADCVQCGLCERSCPEQAITLQPGFLADVERRASRRICKEEAPFECVSCGKPFATASTIANIKAKLVDHPYFAGDAITRLEMCEDCRVKDVWRELARDPEAQLKV